MKVKSSLAFPTYKGFGISYPAEVDYDCIVDIEDNGDRLVIKGAYIPELDLTLGAHQLTLADKQRILVNLKLH